MAQVQLPPVVDTHGLSSYKDSILVSETEMPYDEKHSIRRPSKQPRHLVVSPYTEQEHLLDLDTLDTENQLLAEALTHMTCLREDYATAPYLETFNWSEIVEHVRELAQARNHTWKETSFYIVAFRSQIPPTTQYGDLGVLDKAAHAEATASGGFLK